MGTRPRGSKKKPERLSSTFETINLEGGKVTASIDYGADYDTNKPYELVIFATPNGASSFSESKLLERQSATLRANHADKNIVIAYVSPNNGKWPNFLSANPLNVNDINNAIRGQVEAATGASPLGISFDAHSGGGSYIFNMINNFSEIPSSVASLNLYDCLYAYNGISHGQKIRNWLINNPSATLANITGTPQIAEKQAMLVSDLTSLGIQFSTLEQNPVSSTITALNGRIKLTTLSYFDHNGTVTRNGFLHAHTGGETPITTRMA
ncbi:hypothetical protein IT411_01280 [Candidatus Peregrinibacteria bacterium]|nr:hypothetical protein [Candidatus Peregrinibacteria bacterium]